MIAGKAGAGGKIGWAAEDQVEAFIGAERGGVAEIAETDFAAI